MPSAVDWLQIPAGDITRAKKFYKTICGVSLEQLEMPSTMEMWAFPADHSSGEVGGALVCGEGAVASATGTMVFLNGDPDLQGRLDRVEGAGGRTIAAKTAIGMGKGYVAIITDSEGNTVGLHSQG